MLRILLQPKILGACVIGCALVAGAYTVSNFGYTSSQPNVAMTGVASEAPARVYIEPVDTDGDGVEDWQADFVNRAPIIQSAPTAEPEPFVPTTLTDQVSIQFFESILRAREGDGIGLSEEQIIAQTVERVHNTVNDTIYTNRDISVVPQSSAAIVTYGNTMGSILMNNNVANSAGELDILDRAMRTEDPTILSELEPLARMYKMMRDQSLNTPVPEQFVKEHLDLINVYHALYMNISGLQLALEDPTMALLRIKRYQDDATGLAIALRNMYNVLIPHASLFTTEDPVIAFLPFGPINN